jgi:hypothetical protein
MKTVSVATTAGIRPRTQVPQVGQFSDAVDTDLSGEIADDE